MPLRDHFDPSDDNWTWEGLHGMWPGMIVQRLFDQLPKDYAASPRVHLGLRGEPYEYEVLVRERGEGRRPVAAIEIACPADKDSPAHRRAFAEKCASHLRQGVSVTIVDVLLAWPFNLYAEVLASLGRNDPAFGRDSPSASVASCQWTPEGDRLQTWARPLAVGRPLPTLPLWLDESLTVLLDLEAIYEETCRVLRIP